MSNNSNEQNRPTHAVYQVIDIGEKQRWNRIGSAWVHKDLKGASMKFDSYPAHGRVVLREISEQDDAETGTIKTKGGR